MGSSSFYIFASIYIGVLVLLLFLTWIENRMANALPLFSTTSFKIHLLLLMPKIIHRPCVCVWNRENWEELLTIYVSFFQFVSICTTGFKLSTRTHHSLQYTKRHYLAHPFRCFIFHAVFSTFNKSKVLWSIGMFLRKTPCCLKKPFIKLDSVLVVLINKG